MMPTNKQNQILKCSARIFRIERDELIMYNTLCTYVVNLVMYDMIQYNNSTP